MKLRAYASFFQDKKTGKLTGETEPSLSMGESENEVRVYCEFRSLKEIKKFYKEKKIQTPNQYLSDILKQRVDTWNKENPNDNCKLVMIRLGTKDCPVKIDWTYRILWKQKKVEWDKYKWRNLPFVQIRGLKNEI